MDVVDAFPSVKSKDVLDWLTEGRSMYIDEFGRFQRLANPGWFSWYAAKAITDLVTFKGFLPRGAPTSPRIFDLICEPLDKALQKLGIPLQEQKRLAGVAVDAVFDSVSVATTFKETLEKAGVMVSLGTKDETPVAFERWTFKLDGTANTQPKFAYVDTAAKVLGESLVRQLKEKHVEGCLFHLDECKNIADREVGWLARCFV